MNLTSRREMVPTNQWSDRLPRYKPLFTKSAKLSNTGFNWPDFGVPIPKKAKVGLPKRQELHDFASSKFLQEAIHKI